MSLSKTQSSADDRNPMIAPYVTAAVDSSGDEALVERLVERAQLQANLFDSGQMQRWWAMIGLGADFSLFEPFGGAARLGFDPTTERLAELSRNFRNGGATVELEQSYVSRDMVVLVYIERQDGEVHGLPIQDWSLRVTQVFRRHGQDWQLVHRHADPLVRSTGIDVAAALAAGRKLAPTVAYNC